MYEPTVDVSTVSPPTVTVSAPEASEAVAPASVYVPPSSIVASVPLGVTTGLKVSSTFTVLTTSVASLPAASVAE